MLIGTKRDLVSSKGRVPGVLGEKFVVETPRICIGKGGILGILRPLSRKAPSGSLRTTAIKGNGPRCIFEDGGFPE